MNICLLTQKLLLFTFFSWYKSNVKLNLFAREKCRDSNNYLTGVDDGIYVKWVSESKELYDFNIKSNKRENRILVTGCHSRRNHGEFFWFNPLQRLERNTLRWKPIRIVWVEEYFLHLLFWKQLALSSLNLKQFYILHTRFICSFQLQKRKIFNFKTECFWIYSTQIIMCGLNSYAFLWIQTCFTI